MNHPRSAPPKKWREPARDEIIEEIHAYRAALSDRLHGNLEEMVRYYQSLDVPIRRSSLPPQPRRVPSVPSMGRILLDERSQPELITTTVAKRKA
jgi:hypothetical protein